MGSQIEQLVARAAAEVLSLDVSQVRPGSDIIDDLGGSSLELLEIVTRLEDELHLKIADEEVASLTSIQSIIDVLRPHAATTDV